MELSNILSSVSIITHLQNLPTSQYYQHFTPMHFYFSVLNGGICSAGSEIIEQVSRGISLGTKQDGGLAESGDASHWTKGINEWLTTRNSLIPITEDLRKATEMGLGIDLAGHPDHARLFIDSQYLDILTKVISDGYKEHWRPLLEACKSSLNRMPYQKQRLLESQKEFTSRCFQKPYRLPTGNLELKELVRTRFELYREAINELGIEPPVDEFPLPVLFFNFRDYSPGIHLSAESNGPISIYPNPKEYIKSHIRILRHELKWLERSYEGLDDVDQHQALIIWAAGYDEETYALLQRMYYIPGFDFHTYGVTPLCLVLEEILDSIYFNLDDHKKDRKGVTRENIRRISYATGEGFQLSGLYGNLGSRAVAPRINARFGIKPELPTPIMLAATICLLTGDTCYLNYLLGNRDGSDLSGLEGSECSPWMLEENWMAVDEEERGELLEGYRRFQENRSNYWKRNGYWKRAERNYDDGFIKGATAKTRAWDDTVCGAYEVWEV